MFTYILDVIMSCTMHILFKDNKVKVKVKLITAVIIIINYLNTGLQSKNKMFIFDPK